MPSHAKGMVTGNRMPLKMTIVMILRCVLLMLTWQKTVVVDDVLVASNGDVSNTKSTHVFAVASMHHVQDLDLNASSICL